MIRIDDFPHGDRRLFIANHSRNHLYRKIVAEALNVFELNKVDYILGASPLLFQDGDVEFLNETVHHGKVVLHGFTHGWERDPWSSITSCWPTGGEFSGLSCEEIRERYERSLETISKVNCFSSDHFIAPFNCYNQELLDVLSETPVKFIHTSDEFWDEYDLADLNYYDIEPVISKFKVTYDDANKVINNLHDESQITLHWCYDVARYNWLDDYQKLCNEVKKG